VHGSGNFRQEPALITRRTDTVRGRRYRPAGTLPDRSFERPEQGAQIGKATYYPPGSQRNVPELVTVTHRKGGGAIRCR